MLEMSPSLYLSGTFGHDASTAKVGKARGCCWAAAGTPSKQTAAIAASSQISRQILRLVLRVMASSQWPDVLLRTGSNEDSLAGKSTRLHAVGSLRPLAPPSFRTPRSGDPESI